MRLLSALAIAFAAAAKHRQLHAEFTQSLDTDLVQTWEQSIVKWEADFEQANPYADVGNGEYIANRLTIVD